MHLEFSLEPGIRLDTGISVNFPDLFSRSHVQKLIKEGKVLVNGEVCIKTSYKSQVQTNISIDYDPPAEYELHANADFSVPVIYQDKFLAIIHKPAGMTVHPGAGTKEDTLVHALLSQIDRLSDGSEENRPGIVHRLDRETEGLMVIAKDNHTHFELARLFSARKIIKEYYAAVWGITPDFQKVDGFIGRHPADRKKMLFEQIRLNESFRDSSMEFSTLQRSEYFSLIKVSLFTGRTHQIRASMSKLDHPVVGDEIYSRFSRRLDKTRLSGEVKDTIISGGLYLLAFHLAFVHPSTGEYMNFELPLPARFVNLMKI